MNSENESSINTIIFFLVITYITIFFYIFLYHIGIIPSIEAMTFGIINRSLILGLILFVISIYGIVILCGKMKLKDIGLRKTDAPKGILFGIIIWIVVQVIEAFVGFLNNNTFSIDPLWTSQTSAIIGLLIAMLLGIALFEETGFRGFLLIQFNIKLENKSRNKSLRVILALILSQLFFISIHIPWKIYSQNDIASIVSDLIFSVFVNGIIYGLLYLKTKNLFYVMMIHALGNAPTSLFLAPIQPSILILLLGIIFAVIWPKLGRTEQEISPKKNIDLMGKKTV